MKVAPLSWVLMGVIVAEGAFLLGNVMRAPQTAAPPVPSAAAPAARADAAPQLVTLTLTPIVVKRTDSHGTPYYFYMAPEEVQAGRFFLPADQSKIRVWWNDENAHENGEFHPADAVLSGRIALSPDPCRNCPMSWHPLDAYQAETGWVEAPSFRAHEEFLERTAGPVLLTEG